MDRELEFALIAGKSALILAADAAGPDSIAGDRCRKSATVIQGHIDALSTPPAPDDVKRYVPQVELDVAGAVATMWEVSLAEQVEYPEYVLASDYDSAIAEATRLIDAWREQAQDRVADWVKCEKERDALQARVEAAAAWGYVQGATRFIGTEDELEATAALVAKEFQP